MILLMLNRYVGLWVLGGLGNQMFQYAAGYSLAKKLQFDLLLDLSGFCSYDLRQYRLGEFMIKCSEWAKTSPANTSQKILKIKSYLAKYGVMKAGNYDVLYEKGFHIDDRFFIQNSNCYLWGYWQSPKYFEEHASDICNIFNLSKFESPELREILHAAETEKTVSVHVRRGDYIKAETKAVHGICNIEYYERAKALMLSIEPDAKFMIFSDDPAAAREMFATWKNTSVVECASDTEEMLVMNRCKHHIIANSSFSWWAAWLDRKKSGCVIAPKCWFSKEKMLKTYVLDLFPDEWILL